MASVEQATQSLFGAPQSSSSRGVSFPRGARLGAAFWRLWCAHAISSSGDGLVNVASPLLAITLTRSPLAIAGVMATNRASAALSTFPAGALADRLNRRRLMIGCDLVAGVALAGLVAAMSAGVIDLAMVYLATAVLAACNVAYVLAAQASVPVIVADQDLAKANGRLQAVEGVGEQFLGPGSGGFLFSVARRLPFGADAVSFFVAALLVRRSLPKSPGYARSRTTEADARPSARAYRGRHWAADFQEGFRWLRGERRVQLLAAMTSALVIGQNMVFAILVVYGTGILHLSSAGYGFFFASASALGIVASFFGGVVVRRMGAGRAIVAGTALAMVSYLGLGFTRNAVLAVFVLGLQEIGTVVTNVGSITTRQRLIPSGLYGRVGGLYRLSFLLTGLMGAVLGGVVADAVSVRATMVMAGGITLVLLALFSPPLLRGLAQPVDAAATTAAPIAPTSSSGVT